MLNLSNSRLALILSSILITLRGYKKNSRVLLSRNAHIEKRKVKNLNAGVYLLAACSLAHTWRKHKQETI